MFFFRKKRLKSFFFQGSNSERIYRPVEPGDERDLQRRKDEELHVRHAHRIHQTRNDHLGYNVSFILCSSSSPSEPTWVALITERLSEKRNALFWGGKRRKGNMIKIGNKNDKDNDNINDKNQNPKSSKKSVKKIFFF